MADEFNPFMPAPIGNIPWDPPQAPNQDFIRQQMAEALMRYQPSTQTPFGSVNDDELAQMDKMFPAPRPDGSVQSPNFHHGLEAQAQTFDKLPPGKSIGGPVQEQLPGRQYDPQFMRNGQLIARPDRSVPGVEMWITPQSPTPRRPFR